MNRKPTYYHCGICECFHPAIWDGDCRNDNARFAADELDTKHGANGWNEIGMDDIEAWRAGGISFYQDKHHGE